MSDLIKKEYFYSHPIQKVWNAISQGENISKWFIQAVFKPEVGYKYSFVHEQTTVSGKVLEVVPITKLVYTWVVGGIKGKTVVRWQLESTKGGTRLTLEHSGFSNYDKELLKQMFDSSSKGWDACINELEKFLVG